jgi:hypothetical protein
MQWNSGYRLALLLLAAAAASAQSDSALIVAVSSGIDIDLHDRQPVQFAVKSAFLCYPINR